MMLKRFRNILVITFALLGMVLQGQNINPGDIDYAKPKKYEIGGITVSGVKYLDNNALVMLSGLSVGDIIQIPGDAITRAIQNLWKQGLFENVKITATRIQNDLIF